jgi:hypothetical protein
MTLIKAVLGNTSNSEWHKHRNALFRIVGLRGGFDTVNKEDLRITLAWYVPELSSGGANLPYHADSQAGSI